MGTLHFQDASIGYGSRTVLRNISLTVSPGEVMAVVGPNGVGKSTLVRAACGVVSLQEGQVVVLMGRTPYLGWFERESESDVEIAREALRRVGLLGEAHRMVGELSGGEQQLVLVARALAQEAKVVVLDEPTAHLDLRHQDEVLKLVRMLADEDDLAVLLTLHDLNLVARYCDRVALLSDGAIHRLGLPADVLTPEELEAVYGIAIHVMPHPIHGTPLVLTG